MDMRNLLSQRWHLPILGLAQGLVLAFLHYNFEIWQNVAWPLRLLLEFATLLPLLIYATEQVPGLNRRARVGVVLPVWILSAALLEYSVWVFRDTRYTTWEFVMVAPVLVLTFVLAHLLMHYRSLNPTHHAYEDLFNTTWRNAILCGMGVALSGVFWFVLHAGAMLFASIGIDGLNHLIDKSWFNIPLTALVFSLVITLGLLREELIINVRRLVLGLLKWFLPLVLLVAAVWVVFLPFTGVAKLFASRSAGATMLWTVAMAILFANAAYQNGRSDERYPARFGRLLSYLWLAIMVVSGIAVWALSLRINQYAWTSDRVWGAFVASLAVGYAVGYAMSLWGANRNVAYGWMPTIGRTNIMMAVVLCCGIFLLQGPRLDSHRLEANSQLKRLSQMHLSANDGKNLDLRFTTATGRWGVGALDRMASANFKPADAAVAALLPAATQEARLVLAQNRTTPQRVDGTSLGALRIDVVNPQATNVELDRRLREPPKGNDRQVDTLCRSANGCSIWWADLNGDNVTEAVIFAAGSKDDGVIYALKDGKLKRVGSLQARDPYPRGDDQLELLPAIRNGHGQLMPSPWWDVDVNGRRYNVQY